MKRITLLTAFALCLPLTAHADDATMHAKAKELVGLLHADRMIGQVSTGIKKRVTDAAAKTIASNPSPENQAKLSDFDKKISDQVDAQVGWAVMEPEFVNIYAKTFTEGELDSIIAFFKSPAGSAFLDKTPAMNTQTTQIAQGKVNTLQQELNQSFDEFRKSLAPAPAPTLGPPSGSSTTPPTTGTPK